jgi:hypothetical protein
METCTFCALAALNWKVTRESDPIHGYRLPGKFKGEACAATFGSEANRTGAGTNSCLPAVFESPDAFFVWAKHKQVPPANTAVNTTDSNARFISYNLLGWFVFWNIPQ